MFVENCTSELKVGSDSDASYTRHSAFTFVAISRLLKKENTHFLFSIKCDVLYIYLAQRTNTLLHHVETDPKSHPKLQVDWGSLEVKNLYSYNTQTSSPSSDASHLFSLIL